VSWGFYPSCRQARLFEECEGVDLGFQTCESLEGFASGTLRCSPSCTLDTRGCSECTTDPAIIRCGVSPLPFTPDMVALGASETEIGVFAATFREGNAPELSFTRLAATLDGLSVTPIVEPALPKPEFGYVSLGSLLVAPLPSGWVVGLFIGPKLYLHVLDAAGEPVRRMVLDDSLGFGFFVPRPDGGPLLVWAYSPGGGYYGSFDLRASVIAADGGSMTTPIVLPRDSASLVDLGSGAYLDGAFYVPFTVSEYYGDPQLRVARIGTDGALVARLAPLPDERVMQPSLTAGHGRLQLTYTGRVAGYYYNYNDKLLWRSLSTTGAAVGAAVPLELSGWLAGWPMSVAGDTVYEIQSGSGDNLELVRLDEAGGIAAHSQIVRPTFLGFEWFTAVPRGPDVVLGWFVAGSHQLRLARVTP